MNSDQLFFRGIHGTSIESASQIKNEGFKLPITFGLVGRGIYFFQFENNEQIAREAAHAYWVYKNHRLYSDQNYVDNFAPVEAKIKIESTRQRVDFRDTGVIEELTEECLRRQARLRDEKGGDPIPDLSGRIYDGFVQLVNEVNKADGLDPIKLVIFPYRLPVTTPYAERCSSFARALPGVINALCVYCQSVFIELKFGIDIKKSYD